MRYLIYSLLFITSNLSAQTFSIPVATFDTMVFEIFKGRACSKVSEAQAKEIEIQGVELLQTNTALKLTTSIIEARNLQLVELTSALEKTEQKASVDVRQAKRKGMRLGLGIGGIVAIVCLLL